jgi:hypothetical protein
MKTSVIGQKNSHNIKTMQMTEPINPVSVLVPPAAVTGAMWLSSSNSPSTLAVACAYLMLQWSWGSYLLWNRGSRNSLPVFAIIVAVYWIYFAPPLFWSEPVLFAGRFVPLSEDYLTQAMLMALLAVGCQRIGMKTPVGTAFTQRLPDIDQRASSSWAYIRGVLVITTLIGLYGPSIYLLGGNGRNIMIILTTTIPTAAFLLLLRRCWTGNASPVDKPLLFVVAAARVVGFLASGWMGPTVGLGLTVVGLFVLIHRRIPWTPILLTLAAILFLQVGKAAFRDLYWGANAQASAGILERAGFWLNTSASKWSDALFNLGAETTSTQLASRTMERASLLGQVAHVLELTPSQVPFQNGQTYSYLAITLIPRFIWPEKPSVSEANRFYQIAYGLTPEKDLDKTSIAVGSMAEGYINFGWLGVIFVMLGIGAILRIYEVICLTNRSNTLLLAIGIALLPTFLAIEGQLAQYLAGTLQNIFLTFCIFLPITTKKFGVPAARRETSAIRTRSYRTNAL